MTQIDACRHLADELPPVEVAPDVERILEGGTRKPFYSSADDRSELKLRAVGILAEFPFLFGGDSST